MRRPSTRPLGQAGEETAARFLERRGLRILERNVRSRLGEIDLVARDGRTLVFVEVKARQGRPGEPPQVAVDARKRARLGRLALGYLGHGPRAGRSSRFDGPCRFDVVAVTLDPEGAAPGVEHFAGAFVLDGWPV